MEKPPTHNERILAGALLVMLGTKAADTPGMVTTFINIGFDYSPMDMVRVGYQMMGINDTRNFVYQGAPYEDALGPAIKILYDRFAIVEQIMNS